MAHKYYAVATMDSEAVLSTWDEALEFLHKHPGKEFHKKLSTRDEALQFLRDKRQEFDSTERVVVVESTPAPIVTATACEEDDEPPW